MQFGSQVERFEFAGIPLAGDAETGHVVGLTAEGARLLDRMAAGELSADAAREEDPALIDHLRAHGFFDEAPRARLRAAYLHVTQRCNLRCAGCYSDDGSRNDAPDPSLADEMRAVEQLAACGVRKLVISGGEPFLRADLPHIVSAAKNAGVGNVTVLTNGTVRADEALDALAGQADCIAVSFDGASADAVPLIRREQRFDQLVAFTAAVRARGIPATITATIHARNLGDMDAYAALADELGATVNFSLLSQPVGTDFDAGAMLPAGDQARFAHELWRVGTQRANATVERLCGSLTCRRSCGAGCREVSVDVRGDVYPCHMIHDARYRMGNVFAQNLACVLRGEAAASFAALDVRRFDECATCFARLICGGGCRARAISSGAGLHGPDAYCAMNREFYAILSSQLEAVFGKGA